MRWSCLLVLVMGCLALGCAASDGHDEVSAVDFPIVDGTPAPDEEAVVLVKVVGGVLRCSGTFISPSVVLTAKHCVQVTGGEGPHPESIVSIGLGPNFGETTDYRARRIDTTPGQYTTSLSGLIGVDVATITIHPDRDGNFPDVTPIGVHRASPEEFVGEEVIFVGYGTTPAGTSGTKLRTTGEITSVDAGVIFSAMNICEGDSGGPMLLDRSPREIIGVASFGQGTITGGSCPSSRDGHNRVDIFVGMVDAALYEAGDCPIMEDEVCDSLDNDCDGTTDEGCKSLGESCSTDDECAYTDLPERFGVGIESERPSNPVVCGDTPTGRVCTRRCDPLQPRTSCSSIPHPFRSRESFDVTGAYCIATMGCDATCVAGVPGAAAIDEPCSSNTDCQTLFCDDPGDGARRCLLPCQGGAAVCPADRVCAAGEGVCGACVPPEILDNPRGLGEACTLTDECTSGVCFLDGPLSYCSLACEGFGSCPSGFHCRSDRCARGAPGQDGDACMVDDDCQGTRQCVDGLCGRPCTDMCDDGLMCRDGFCRVEALPLGRECTADTECHAGRCALIDDVRICTRACGGAGSCASPGTCREVAGELLCGPVAPEPSGGGGGCSVGGTAPAASIWALLLLGRRRRSKS